MLSSMPRSDCGRWLPIFALLWFVIGAPAVGDQTAQQKKPTGAVVDIEQSEFGAILESKLLSNDRVNWLERSQIDRILKERELTQLFSVDGAGERKQLGQLLQANLLVLIRSLPAGEANQRRYDLAVCETSHGLRLFRAELIGTADIQADAEHVAESIVKCFDRVHLETTVLFAVPPFVSGDLELEFDYMKAAYAKLVEEQLLAQPGVLVVELDEALSIAREYQLASESARLQRLLPYYILGEYRHHNRPEGGSIDLSVTLRYGEQELAKIQRTELKPNAAAEFLLTATTDMMSQTAIQPAKLKDAAIEAQILSERAKEFRKLGNFSEAIDLIEAALLLQPGDIELHQQAFSIYDYYCPEYFRVRQKDVKKAQLFLPSLSRWLDHFEITVISPQTARLNPYEMPMGLGMAFAIASPDGLPLERLVTEEDSVKYKAREVIARASIKLAKAKRVEAILFIRAATSDVLKTRQYKELELRLHKLAIDPDSNEILHAFATCGYDAKKHNTDEGRAYFKRLAASEHRILRNLGRALLQELEINSSDKVKGNQSNGKSQDNGPDRREVISMEEDHDPKKVEFRPLELEVMDGIKSKSGTKLTDINECIPVGPDLDVVCNNGLFLVKSRGNARKLNIPNLPHGAGLVRFDGKFLWIVSWSEDKGFYIVCHDLASEQSTMITTKEGLPRAGSSGPLQNLDLNIAPLEPGRVCVAGTFGRSWVAIIEVTPNGPPNIEVIHEARELCDNLEADGWKNTRLGFSPYFMESLTQFGTQPLEQRVLIGRDVSDVHCAASSRHPLVIDPSAKTTSVLEHVLDGKHNSCISFAVHQSTVYQLHYEFNTKQVSLIRFRLPSLVPEIVASRVPQGVLRISNGHLHIIGKKWWTMSLQEDVIHYMARVPWYFSNRWSHIADQSADLFPPRTPDETEFENVYHSANYGFIVRVRKPRGQHSLVTAKVFSSTSDK